MMRRSKCWLLASALFLPDPAKAWGDDGHKVIALVASHYLTPAAAEQVAQLLAGPALPGIRNDKAEVPGTIADRATWADRYRDSDRRTVAGSRYMATRAWHFIDVELDRPGSDAACFGHPALQNAPFPGRPDNCVVDKIRQFTAVLSDPQAAHDDKVIAFDFLLHLVGDVHQPLHAADHHDRGGNSVNVRYTYKAGSASRSSTMSLHAYWDKITVGRLGSSPESIASLLVASMPRVPSGAWLETDPAIWASGSFAVAKAKAYKLPRLVAGAASIPLSTTYAIAATGAARKQLQLGGYRLAMLLSLALR